MAGPDGPPQAAGGGGAGGAGGMGGGPGAGGASERLGSGWLLSPIESILNQKHPLAFIVLIPLIILFLRLLLRWLMFLNRVLLKGSGGVSPGLFMPRRVHGSVHGYGVVELKGRRPYMEDRHTVVPNINDNPNLTLYAVFDGHGGDAASQFCTDYMGAILAESQIDLVSKPQAALAQAFKTLDQKFLELAHMRKMDDGTTALVALAHGKNITIANAGDSRALLVQFNGRVMPLSRDHKPDRNDERDRIARLGGSVVHWGVWRVEGILAVSRAIGDRLLKDYVIPDPEFQPWVCSQDDMFLVLATDGLWDVIDNQQVGKLLTDCKDAQEAAEKLTEEAFQQGTMDNVTVLVVDLRDASHKAVASFQRSHSETGSVVDGTSGSIPLSKARRKWSEDEIDTHRKFE
jgi:protein phosphatase 1L